MTLRSILVVIARFILALTFAASTQAAGVVGQCSEADLLRALSGGGAVTFSCNGTILLTSPIVISSSTTIDGTGQSVTISGGGAVQVFSVSLGASLSLNNLTITAGSTPLFGGAISNDEGTVVISNTTFSGNSALFLGGAIFNLGTLSVTNSTFSGNSAAISNGGAIVNDSVANITASTFVNNTANSGGAIDNSTGSLQVVNSTFYHNRASDLGGAILNDDTTTAINNTIVENSAPLGGGVDDNMGTVTIDNNIVVGNSGGDCVGAVIGAGNLSTDGSCPGIQSSNPLLGPLQFNGGPTYTIALLSGSPAIDAAILSDCPATDQRGVPRPQGAGCDIGAYERASAPASGQACITYYNDNFNSDITVSPGQICGFVSGGVTGNVTLNGGNLVLSNAVAAHNVTVNAGNFYVAPGTTVGGNLVVQNVPSGTPLSQLCGSNVLGNVQVQNSGAPLNLGSTVPSACPGNTIGNDLQVHNNTAETELIGNTVSGDLQDHDNSALTLVIGNSIGNDLQCQNNFQIVGGPNKGKRGKRIQGQCY